MLLILFIGFWEIKKFGDRESCEIERLDFYARNGKWDEIIRESNKREIYNYLYLNYLNLALEQKGLLLIEMFNYNQHGILGLKVSSQDKRVIAPLLSDISFCIGDLASSRQYAFEGYEACPGGGSGRLMKRLVKTSIISENDAVAKKYIGILRHTSFYKNWATDQQQFLCKDSLCKKDKEVIEKREYLPPSGSRDFTSDFPDILKRLCKIYPGNRHAADYLLAFYLLAKDVKSFTSFLNECRNGKILADPLPLSCQQALLVFYESQPDRWKSVGISEEIIRQYNDYKSVFKLNYRNTEVDKIMKKRFGSTYWFYYQFI